MNRQPTRASCRQFKRMNVPFTAIVFAALLLAPRSLFATAQVPDFLIVDADTFAIQTNPLEPYLEDNPGVIPPSNAISTANWRGYVAMWSVKDDRLCLADITVRYWIDSAGERRAVDRSVLTTVFPGGAPIFAKWFSGWLVVRTGELVEYVHQGYASTFESYRLIRVRDGRVIEQRRVDSTGFLAFRAEQFAKYRQTPEYARAFEVIKRRSPSSTDAEIEEFMARIDSGTYTSIDFGE